MLSSAAGQERKYIVPVRSATAVRRWRRRKIRVLWIGKRLLIHHARPLSGKVERLELGDDMAATTGFAAVAEMETVLSRLGAIRPRLRTVVELKVFESLTAEEIPERTGMRPFHRSSRLELHQALAAASVFASGAVGE